MGGLKLLDLGSLAHAAADAILPEDMEWACGVIGAAVDFQSGNPIGALKEGLLALSDLRDLAEKKPSGGPKTAPAPRGSCYCEPSPPPRYQWCPSSGAEASASASATTTTTTTVTATSTARSTSTSTVTSTSVSAQATVGRSEASAPAPSRTPAPAEGLAPSTPQRSSPPPLPGGWRPASPAPTPGTLRATPPQSSLPSLPRSFTELAATPWRPFGPKDPSTMSKDEFMAQGSEAFMKAVRDGKIPKEISDSPGAMQTLQAHMNQISEMNQLMTAMIQAMHQMQMAVIQNVRV